MVTFRIATNRRDFICNEHGDVYNFLYYTLNVDAGQAIDAASWCELACIGEVYQGDDFIIIVEENDT